MSVSHQPLRNQVIVITGASSGIGLATAKAAALAGAKVVLAARNGEALQEMENQIRSAGGEASHVVADVGKQGDVRRIAEAAVWKYGGFDTWVNNAGGSIYGRLEQVSIEDSRQLFETNFWGTVYGSLIAVEHLMQRGGALINVGSVASETAIPLQGMYTATKHAIKGFTDTLRIELEEEKAPISVTLIKPTCINTPFPHHAKNYLPNEPKLADPLYPPEEVANAILYAATHSKRDIYVGGTARLMTAAGHQVPRLVDWVSEKLMFDSQKRDEAPRNPEGNLYRAGPGGGIHGDHPGLVYRRSIYTQMVTHPILAGAFLIGGVALLGWLTGAFG
jgi:short-subunit dehydrogenase